MQSAPHRSLVDGDVRLSARTAMIFGAGGQDGTYLCRILEAEGTCVVKVTRTSVQFGAEVWPPVALADPAAIQRLLVHFRPEEIYYLAAYHQSAEQDAGELQGLF